MYLLRLPYGYASRIRLISCIGSMLLSAAAFAQWPTSYTSPKIVGGGTNVRAGAIRTDNFGGAYVTFANINAASHQVEIQKYNVVGEQLFPNSDVSGDNDFTVWLQLLNSPSTAEIGILMESAKSRPGSNESSFRYQHIDSTGVMEFALSSYRMIPFAGTNFQGYRFAAFVERTDLNNYSIVSYSPVPTEGIELKTDTQIGAADIYAFPNDYVLGCYTIVGQQAETPGKVWSLMLDGSTLPPELGTARELDSSPLVDQSKPQIAPLNDTKAMASWLGEVDGKSDLYAAVLNSNGAIVSPARNCFENVQDYVVTSSTLGLPVFAAVVRTSENPRVESLVGGLINPNNGGTLTIPVSEEVGVKIKALRQETNGDFSLVYSVPENGTNLLKVRRISGVSAATLWETTVADLGWASDEIIESHPNTWIAGNADNVLYILARYDEPNTVNSSFQLVRLRADGSMGGD